MSGPPPGSRLAGIPGAGALAYCSRRALSPEGGIVSSFSGPLVLVQESVEELEDIRDAVSALAPVFGGKELTVAFFGEDPRERLSSLQKLSEGARLVLALPESLRPAPAAQAFSSAAVEFKLGLILPRDEAVARLAAAGYKRVDFVETPGEFAVRGAVLDFFSLEPQRAVRALYDEDRIESLRVFDPLTQATSGLLSAAKAAPAAEAGEATIADWLGADSLWLAREGLDIAPPPGARLLRTIALPEPGDLDFGARPLPPFGGRRSGPGPNCAPAPPRVDDPSVLPQPRRDARMQEVLEGNPPEAAAVSDRSVAKRISSSGRKLLVLSTSEIFQRNYRPPSRWRFLIRENEVRSASRNSSRGLRRPPGLRGLPLRGLRPVKTPVGNRRLPFAGISGGRHLVPADGGIREGPEILRGGRAATPPFLAQFPHLERGQGAGRRRRPGAGRRLIEAGGRAPLTPGLLLPAGKRHGAGVRGGVSLRRDPGPGPRHPGSPGRHGVPAFDGAARGRRCGLRQDRGRDARRLPLHRRFQAGRRPGPHHHPGRPAFPDLLGPIRGLSGPAGTALALPIARQAQANPGGAGGRVGGHRGRHRAPSAEGRPLQGPGVGGHR